MGEERLEGRVCLVSKHLCPGASAPGGVGLISGSLCPELVPWAEFSSTGTAGAQRLGQGFAPCWGAECVPPARRCPGKTGRMLSRTIS